MSGTALARYDDATTLGVGCDVHVNLAERVAGPCAQPEALAHVNALTVATHPYKQREPAPRLMGDDVVTEKPLDDWCKHCLST